MNSRRYPEIKVKNPMDDAALIYVGYKGEEICRDVGHGDNRRIVLPSGDVIPYKKETLNRITNDYIMADFEERYKPWWKKLFGL